MTTDPEKVTETPDCPAEAELSAWFDGEGEENFSAHLAECKECREKIYFYSSLNDAMRSLSVPDSDLAERIHAKCMEESSTTAPSFFFGHNTYLKAAAILAVIAGTALTLNFLGSRTQTTGPAGQSSSGEITSSQNSGPVATAGSSNTPLQFIQLVSAGENRPGGPRPLNYNNTIPRILPQSVHHVWVVDNLKKAREELTDLLPHRLCATSSEEAICVRTVLTDRQLQRLVDKLDNLNWALVSPTLPQPGELDRLHMTGRQITYVAEIVRQ